MERQLLKLVTTLLASPITLNYLGNQFGAIGELRTHCIGAECLRGKLPSSVPPLLDVALNEDNCRIRKDNAPENFAVMRRLAVNLLGREKSKKRGVKNKQFLAAMDNEYLPKVLATA